MQVQRVRRSNNTLPLLGCGCIGLGMGVALVGVVAVLLLLPALPGLAVRLAGFTPTGSTDAVFSNPPPAVVVQVQNPVVPPDAVIDLGAYGQQPLPADSGYYEVATGTTDTGAPLATVTFTESSLMDLCVQRTQVCANTNDQLRNVRLDLRPGGAVVYADAMVPELGVWQAVGVVLRLDASARQFEVAGVDVGGTLYALPTGALGDQVQQVAASGNELLRQLELEAGGGQYMLSQVSIDDNTLTLVLR